MLQRLPCLLVLGALLQGCATRPLEMSVVSDRDGNLDIYLTCIDSPRTQRLTTSPDAEYGSSWSRDGSRMAFARRTANQYDLHLFERATGTTRQITRDASDQYGPAMSPDGESIAYISMQDHPRGELYLMTVSTGEARRLTHDERMDSSPGFLPDGKRLVYSSFMDVDAKGGPANSELFLLDIASGRSERMTNRPGNDGNAAVSPDGRHVAFSTFIDGKADLFSMRLENAAITRLTEGEHDHRWPRWSPDGRRIAYTRVAGGNSDIWLMDADGGNQRAVIAGPHRDEIAEFSGRRAACP